MKVFCSDQLLSWLRRELWKGADAALILSDMLPDWVEFADSRLCPPDVQPAPEGSIYRCTTICRWPESSALELWRGRENDLAALNRLRRSYEEKIDLMRQRHEDGEACYQTPDAWIGWAVEKRLKINWIEYAFALGFAERSKLLVDQSPALRARYYSQDESAPQAVEPKPAVRYPWGDHKTTLLETLGRAAETLWPNYDPSDPSTAPTNEMVIAWLLEQKVPKRTAEVMATILRAEGLPPGRRR